MTILKFDGLLKVNDVLEFYDTEWEIYTPTIGGIDIIDAIKVADNGGAFIGPVTVAIADESFDGDLHYLWASPGYSEWTPAEPAELTVGPHNLITVLSRYEGQIVTLWIADEPFNTLDPPPVRN